MTKSLWVALTLILTIQALNVSYTGIRTTIGKDILKAQLYKSLANALEDLKAQTWESISYNVTGTLFKLNFTIEEIVCSKAEFTLSNIINEVVSVQDNKIQIAQEGEVLTLEFAFSYDFQLFGMHIFFNTGSMKLKATANNMIFGYKDQAVTASIIPKFAPAEIVVSGGFIFNSALAKWVGLVVEEKLLSTIDAKMSVLVSSKETTAMTKWFSIENAFTTPKEMTIVMNNYVLDVQENPTDFISFGYKTIVQKKDGDYSKTLQKKLNSSISMSGITSMVCMSSDLITAFLEIEGKARSDGFDITSEVLEHQGKASDLYYLMPKLREKYGPSEDLTITCKEKSKKFNENLVINQLNVNANSESTAFNFPIYCTFKIKEDIVLGLSLFTRPTLEKKGSTDSGLLKLKTSIGSNELYYHYIDSKIAQVNSDTLYGLSYKIVSVLKNHITAISEGIRVPMPNSGAKYEPENKNFDEICFKGK